MTDARRTAVAEEGQAWAEMMAHLALRNDKLQSALLRFPKPRTGRGTLIAELERERGRIARDLHAGAGQPLAGIFLNLDLLDRWSEDMPGEAQAALVRLRLLADAALGQIRAVSHRLHPPDWQHLSTEAALRRLVEQTGVASSCETDVEIQPLPADLSHAVKVTLYRCAQEGIANVLRHSGATRFELRLSIRDGQVELRLRDNGRGLPKDVQAKPGIGIRSIREHVRAVDGRVSITSGAEGTKITVSVPFSAE